MDGMHFLHYYVYHNSTDTLDLVLWTHSLAVEMNGAMRPAANDVEAYNFKLGMPVRPLPHFRALAPRWGNLTAAQALSAMRRSKIRAALCRCALRQAAADTYWATAGLS